MRQLPTIAKPQIKDVVLPTVHTRRTMMYTELAAIMAHAEHADYSTALTDNIAGKTTKYNETVTTSLLRKLYSFDPQAFAFRCFQHFWNISSEEERRITTLLYAVGRDSLLSESISVLESTPTGIKVSVESFMAAIETVHPAKYSITTLRSAAQNIASSWKQAGFIEGKVKNIRTQPAITPNIVAFALVLGYLNGARGESLFQTIWTKAIMLPESELRTLTHRAAIAGMLHYQHAGAITIIHFNHLFQTLGIHGDNEQN